MKKLLLPLLAVTLLLSGCSGNSEFNYDYSEVKKIGDSFFHTSPIEIEEYMNKEQTSKIDKDKEITKNDGEAKTNIKEDRVLHDTYLPFGFHPMVQPSTVHIDEKETIVHLNEDWKVVPLYSGTYGLGDLLLLKKIEYTDYEIARIKTNEIFDKFIKEYKTIVYKENIESTLEEDITMKTIVFDNLRHYVSLTVTNNKEKQRVEIVASYIVKDTPHYMDSSAYSEQLTLLEQQLGKSLDLDYIIIDSANQEVVVPTKTKPDDATSEDFMLNYKN